VTPAKVRRRIRRPCIVCGASTIGSRCPRHAIDVERARQARQPYRAAYFTPFYRRERAAVLKRSGGQCERVEAGGIRCTNPALETGHRVPLSTARSLQEAIALCDRGNLEAVCWRHNPRGA
jgi:hypothetical protein